MDRIFSVFMPVVILQSLKMIGRLELCGKSWRLEVAPVSKNYPESGTSYPKGTFLTQHHV